MKLVKAIVCGIALSAVQGAMASPIRGNTPGTGVFQRSGVMAGVSVDESGGGGAELLRLSSFAELRYTPSTHWVLALRAPLFVESRFEQPGAAAETASGPGDVQVSVKHRFYRWLGPWADRHAAVEVGLELPTGATDRTIGAQVPVALRRRLQPGSGSIDGLIDIVYQQARKRWSFHADAGYRFNGEGDGFRQGDEVRLNLGTSYVLFPRVYTQPGHEVFAVLEATILDAEDDRLRGLVLPGTGRSALFLAPGLQYVATERLFLDLSLQVPLREKVGRGELQSRWNALFQIRYAL
jgi:hypothetical protein